MGGAPQKSGCGVAVDSTVAPAAVCCVVSVAVQGAEQVCWPCSFPLQPYTSWGSAHTLFTAVDQNSLLYTLKVLHSL